MTSPRPRNWPDGQSTNTPSSAASFGFDVAAELARINHPSARADLRDMPPHGDVEVGRFPIPPSAVGVGASGSRRRPAVGRWVETDRGEAKSGAVRLIVAGFVVGWLWGRRT